jgi:hypothetical protein
MFTETGWGVVYLQKPADIFVSFIRYWEVKFLFSASVYRLLVGKPERRMPLGR